MASLPLVVSELVVALLEIDPSCEVEENFGFLVGLLSAVFCLGVFLFMIDRKSGDGHRESGDAQKKSKKSKIFSNFFYILKTLVNSFEI